MLELTFTSIVCSVVSMFERMSVLALAISTFFSFDDLVTHPPRVNKDTLLSLLTEASVQKIALLNYNVAAEFAISNKLINSRSFSSHCSHRTPPATPTY